MRVPALFGWWIGAALLLGATPAQAAPLSGDLNMLRGAELTGDITWSGGASIVDLDAAHGIPSYSLDLTAARADLHIRKWTSPTAQDGIVNGGKASDEFYTLTNARLETIILHDGAHLTLQALEEDTLIQTSAATLSTAREIAASVDPTHQKRYESGVRPYSLFAQDQSVLDAQKVTVTALGRVVVALWNGEITLAGAEGRQTLAAGERFDEGGPIPVVDDATVREIVWMELVGAKLSLDWGAPTTVAGAAPSLTIEGGLSTPEASGNLLLDRFGVTPRSQSIEMSGLFKVKPRMASEALPVGTPSNKLVEPYDRFSADVEGEADDVYVSGARVTAGLPSGPSPTDVGFAGLGALAITGLVYRYGPLAFALLYSRLEQGELLANPIRSQIYDIVKANPGINARQVHKLSSASWGTVVHHLHKLQDAGYVCTRAHGRAKCFYENHGKWDQYQADLAVLSGEKTARIASSIAQVPGRDQAQIMERTGLSQSTVSYHLLKLEKANLVTKERSGANYVYFPASHLREVMDMLHANGTGLARPSVEGSVAT